jgi:hypothetical protein
MGSCPLTHLDPSLPSSPVSPLTLDRVGLRVYLTPRTPRLRVCQSQNHSHQSPQVGSRSSCCPASLRLVPGLPDPNLPPCAKMPMPISSPKCRCQPPRQNANVNLDLAKLPISIPSPLRYSCAFFNAFCIAACLGVHNHQCATPSMSS